jgi:hypothetical protein
MLVPITNQHCFLTMDAVAAAEAAEAAAVAAAAAEGAVTAVTAVTAEEAAPSSSRIDSARNELEQQQQRRPQQPLRTSAASQPSSSLSPPLQENDEEEEAQKKKPSLLVSSSSSSLLSSYSNILKCPINHEIFQDPVVVPCRRSLVGAYVRHCVKRHHTQCASRSLRERRETRGSHIWTAGSLNHKVVRNAR